jgi:hypothetical protein
MDVLWRIEAGWHRAAHAVHKALGLVAEVPSKFARAGGGRPDFGPKKAKKHTKNPHKTLIKSKLNQKINCATLLPTSAHCIFLRRLRSAPLTRLWCPIHPKQIKTSLKTKSSR